MVKGVRDMRVLYAEGDDVGPEMGIGVTTLPQFRMGEADTRTLG